MNGVSGRPSFNTLERTIVQSSSKSRMPFLDGVGVLRSKLRIEVVLENHGRLRHNGTAMRKAIEMLTTRVKTPRVTFT